MCQWLFTISVMLRCQVNISQILTVSRWFCRRIKTRKLYFPWNATRGMGCLEWEDAHHCWWSNNMWTNKQTEMSFGWWRITLYLTLHDLLSESVWIIVWQRRIPATDAKCWRTSESINPSKKHVQSFWKHPARNLVTFVWLVCYGKYQETTWWLWKLKASRTCAV